MKFNIRIVIFVMTLLTFSAYAQEPVSIILIKGGASYSSKTGAKAVDVSKGARINMGEQATVTLSPGSRMIAYNSDKKVEIYSDKTIVFTYRAIMERLKSQKSVSTTGKFIEYMQKMYDDKEMRKEKAGSVGGASSRGKEDFNYCYSPPDDYMVISDTLRLTWNNDGNPISGKIYVIDNSRNDTLYRINPGQEAYFDILVNREGNYSWIYEVSHNGKTSRFNNTFSVPSSSEKEKKLAEVSAFKSLLEGFSTDTQKSMLQDYLEEGKCYEYSCSK